MDFAKWLEKKIDDEGMTQEEFAKRAGFSKSHVSLVLNGHRGITVSFCKGIGKAFGMKEVDVMILAGLLEIKESRVDYQTEDFLTIFRKLRPEDKEKVLAFARFLLSDYHKT